MKENWTYKKLEDSIEKVKYTTKIQSSDYKSEGLFPIVSQEDEMISGYWDNASDVFKVNKPVVIFGDHTRVLKYVDFDFVLGADGVKILQPIDGLIAKFFLYYLKWCKIPSLGYSRHYKLLKEIEVPVPPLPEQSRIVSELDLLQSIIDKQKAQLKELDNLAQAVFYDMFGDPVENEKGWEVSSYGKEFEMGAGGTPSKDNKEYWEGGTIPWIGSNMCQNCVIYETDGKFITEAGLAHSSAKLLEPDTVLVALVGATIGKAALLKIKTATNQNIAFIKQSKRFSQVFVFYHIMSLNNEFMKIGNGDFKMASQGFIKTLPIILSPLSLQQSFATKIESIEKQKAAITQSIAETQRLFDFTMDKYFG